MSARVAALAARGRLITEALDFLREVASTFMPLPVQAATGAVEAVAAASLHQVAAPLLRAGASWHSHRHPLASSQAVS